MIRVAVYERASSKQGLKNGDLEKTIQYYNDIIEKHKDQDWQLYKCYVDRNALGIHPRNRDGFLEMMIDAELGYFDLIITREISRFARNTEDTLREVRKLRRIGIEVYFIEDNIWSIRFSETN